MKVLIGDKHEDAISGNSGGDSSRSVSAVADRKENQIKGGKSKAMKTWKIAVVITLAAALVLGVALPSLAASDEAVPQTDDCWPRLLRGEVLSVDEVNQESFVIQSGEQEHTIFVNDDTRYFILHSPRKLLGIAQQRIELRQQAQERTRAIEPAEPTQLRASDWAQQPKRAIWAKLKWLRHFGEGASFDDITVGDKVAVWLAPETGSYLAKVVTIIEPVSYGRVSGTITGISDDSITIEPVNGDAVTLEYNENTIFILKGIIEVEAEQFAGAGYNTETMVAKVVRVWPEAPPIP